MKVITFIPNGYWVLKIVLIILSGNQLCAWDWQENVPLGLAKFVKMKLIENYMQE